MRSRVDNAAIVRLRPDNRVSCLISLAAAIALALAPVLKVAACSPVYPFAMIVNWNHPDLPLSIFAKGQLGVIEPAWARSYLVVAYRHLNAVPLDKGEQDGILALWHKRLSHSTYCVGYGTFDQIEAYFKLRNATLGAKGRDAERLWTSDYSYSYENEICDDAFALARQTLAARLKQWGKNSNKIKEWISGQDAVFGIGKAKGTIPKALAGNADKLLKADRDYQIAAATLYSKEFAAAAELFGKIAADRTSPWCSLASYLVARCKANEARAYLSDSLTKETLAYIEDLKKRESSPARQADLEDLLRPLQLAGLSPQQMLDLLAPRVAKPDSIRFGRDTGDLTFVIDQASDEQVKPVALDLRKFDLTDWLDTIQRPYDYWSYFDDEEKKKLAVKNHERDQHAVERWRQTRKLHWLVAAICLNGLRDAQMKDALSEAEKIQPDSPAYLTASFFVIDSLIAQNKQQEARARLSAILARSEIPPSARNLFQAQMLAVANNADQFLAASFMNLPGICENYILLPDDWLEEESRTTFKTDFTALDTAVAHDLNYNLPLSQWLRLCQKTNVRENLRKRLVLATWVRANILGNQTAATTLSKPLARAYPELASLVARYESSPTGQPKQFAMARLILKTYGISPYLFPGVPRHGTALTHFDYYNDNFWLPLRPEEITRGKDEEEEETDYWAPIVQPGENRMAKMMQGCYKPGLVKVLSAREKSEAASERLKIWNNHPSRFLGEIVLAQARLHPSDPDVAELLYKVCRLPKWKGLTPVGSQYSRKAYTYLHTHYPKNQWTEKATCWY